MTRSQALRNQALKLAPWLFLAGLISGCAEMRDYSINSFQGTLPIEDYRRVQINPDNGAPSAYISSNQNGANSGAVQK